MTNRLSCNHQVHHQRAFLPLVCIKIAHLVEPFHVYISFRHIFDSWSLFRHALEGIFTVTEHQSPIARAYRIVEMMR